MEYNKNKDMHKMTNGKMMKDSEISKSSVSKTPVMSKKMVECGAKVISNKNKK